MPPSSSSESLANRPLRIAQLSDTHFLAPGEAAEGGFAYDTAQAFEAVLAAVEDHDPYDLVVVNPRECGGDYYLMSSGNTFCSS